MKFMIVGKTGCFLRDLAQELDSLGISVKWHPDAAEVKDFDVIFIIPEKIREAAETDSGSSFCIIYLTAGNEERSETSCFEGVGGSMFHRVAKKEKSAFADLENWIDSEDKAGYFPQNVTASILLNPLQLDKSLFALTMARHIKRHRKCMDIIRKCIESGTIRSDTTGKVLVASAAGVYEEIPQEEFAEQLLSSINGKASLLDAYLETEIKIRTKAGRSGKTRQLDEAGMENELFQQMSLVL